MEAVNNPLLYQAFLILADGLRPFVERQMRAAYGVGWEDQLRGNATDPVALLGAIQYKWDDAFKDSVAKAARTYAYELEETRHRVMHGEPFNAEDSDRALDSMKRLLAVVGADALARDIEGLKGGASTALPPKPPEGVPKPPVSAYQAEISRSNPGLFVFAIDQSGSMEAHIAGGEVSKAQAVADIMNRFLYELVNRCSKGEEVRDYFHVSVIGYGEDVRFALAGSLAGREVVPISQIADSVTRFQEVVESFTAADGEVRERRLKSPVWFDATAHGVTPMCRALQKVDGIVADWIRHHPSSYPPIVLNITDGISTDGDPVAIATAIRRRRVADGSCLLFNAHVSISATGRPLVFPDAAHPLPSDHARTLFEMSSLLPATFQEVAREMGYAVTPQSRGFAFNADLRAIAEFVDIGSRPAFALG